MMIMMINVCRILPKEDWRKLQEQVLMLGRQVGLDLATSNHKVRHTFKFLTTKFKN